jgi:RNA polymerase sigma factor (sigma-70 family)
VSRDCDQSLVRYAQSGERRAFDQLVLKYRSRVVELAMRYTRNRADAEDATQESFIKAYRGLRHFRNDSAFYTWLYRIASNCAKNLLKARRRNSFKNAIDFSDYHHAVRHPTCLWDWRHPRNWRSLRTSVGWRMPLSRVYPKNSALQSHCGKLMD